MFKLIKLEWKRNRWRAYHITVVISTLFQLGLLYLYAAIPYMDNNSDSVLFKSYHFIVGLACVVSTAIFMILSSVIASKIIIEEYAGKKAILLFSYPVERKKIFDAKVFLVFVYTLLGMIVSNFFCVGIFFITEGLFPMCQEPLTAEIILVSLLSIDCYALIATLSGIVSFWFGFLKKSVAGTIVAACILAVCICQMMGITLFSKGVMAGITAVLFIAALMAWINLRHRVEEMEV